MNNALPEGFVLNGAKPYTIIKRLHNGGFGITYLVKAEVMDGNIPLQAFYTLKEFFVSKHCVRDHNNNVVASSPSAQQLFDIAKKNFLDEANILNKLHHKNIVPVNEVFQQNNTVYYVMKYLGETSLEQYIKQTGRLCEADAIDIITHIANAVAFLHDNKILHFDIKPDNIMICRENGVLTPVLIDFGQACFNNKDKEVRGYTPGYSPKELKDTTVKPGPAADVYSLAATLIAMLTGNAPEDASVITKARLYRTMPENVSERTMETAIRAMSTLPDDRQQTVMLFIAQLTGKGGSVTEPVSVNRTLSMKKIAVAAAALLVISAIIFGISRINYDRSTDGQDKHDEGQEIAKLDTTKQPAPKPEPEPKPDPAPAPKPNPAPVPSPAPTPAQKPDTYNGTLNLGYAVWTGGIRDGKPHGEGTMRFKRSHNIAGCANEAYSGCYVKGFCEKGVLMSGTLYDDSGNKVEDFVR